jgi:hypothetical protein
MGITTENTGLSFSANSLNEVLAKLHHFSDNIQLSNLFYLPPPPELSNFKNQNTSKHKFKFSE